MNMNIKKDVQMQFGQSAQEYVKSIIHRDGKDLTKLIEITAAKGTENALDIATGGGHTANGLAPIVKKVTAFDLTKEMLEAAESFIKGNGNQNVEYIQGDAEKLPFQNETFDIVTCRIAPHHFPNVKQFVSEVYRVLKDDGQFLLDDNVVPEDNELDLFYNTIEKKRDYSHFRAWKKTEWIQMLEHQGFIIEEMYRFEKTFAFQKWCERMKLSELLTKELENFILQSSEKVKRKFSIVIKNQQLLSFKGEAVLIKAVKPSRTTN